MQTIDIVFDGTEETGRVTHCQLIICGHTHYAWLIKALNTFPIGARNPAGLTC